MKNGSAKQKLALRVLRMFEGIVESNEEHAKDVESFGKESKKTFYYVYH